MADRRLSPITKGVLGLPPTPEMLEHPVLLISGYLDFLTPAMQSVEMARRMPHATHYCDPFSTHASILENPERCLPEIDAFLTTDRARFERQSSNGFALKEQRRGEGGRGGRGGDAGDADDDHEKED